jgi:uncharacterized membrane protein YdbT with pleckstrin-like domain
MGYVDENLISGETVTYKVQLHWIVFLKPILIDLGGIGLALLSVYFGYGWIAAALLGVATMPIMVAAIGRSSAEFAVTNKRVILKTGFIQKKTAEMFLNKIESVGVDQSIIGRLLGYGTIVIRGTGGTLEPFDRVSAPLEFRRQVQEQIGRTFDTAARAAKQ